MNNDLLISNTCLPDKVYGFNEISNNIQEQLKNCYEQSKKLLHEEKKHFATGRFNYPLPSLMFGRQPE